MPLLTFYMKKDRHRLLYQFAFSHCRSSCQIRGYIIFQLRNFCRITHKSVAFLSNCMWVSSDVLKTGMWQCRMISVYLRFEDACCLHLQGRLIPCVPLATEPGIYLIILTPMKTQMMATPSTCYDVVTFLTQWGKSASNFVEISSLVVKLLKKCQVR
jgi:hypothetical protein